MTCFVLHLGHSTVTLAALIESECCKRTLLMASL
jgi:hypothetical protein